MSDARDLLYKQILRHAKKIGIQLKRVALIEELREMGGPIEFEEFRDYFKSKGLDAVVADHRDLTLHKGKLFANGYPVQMVYRDTELEEMIEMEKEGDNMKGFREAFRRNAVVSSLMGELDHKSALEILTTPAFSNYFSSVQRRIFKEHVSWTRLLRHSHTTDPHGRKMDPYRYAKRHQEQLVLKPNREFGGVGVIFGKDLTRRDWDTALQKAYKKPGEWVMQHIATIHQKKFITGRGGKLREESLNVVDGFIVTPDGISIIGRGSRREVVNVARQGGLVATLVYRIQ